MINRGLSKLRKRHELTQGQLAEKMGVSRSRVKNIETGTDLRISVLERYMDSCGYNLKIAVFDQNAKHLFSFAISEAVPALPRLRNSNGLTQKALAEKMELSRSRIEQIELGSCDINFSTLNAYISACGLKIMLDIKKK